VRLRDKGFFNFFAWRWRSRMAALADEKAGETL